VNAQRVVVYLRLAIIVQTLLAVFFIAGSYRAVTPPTPPTTTDFASFYAAGVLADQGRATLAYDLPTHRSVEEHVTQPGIDYKFYLNPPFFLLICAPLAKLPYLLAFVLFELVTGLFWLAMAQRIAGGGRLVVLALLAMPSIYWAACWGQNAFLTAGLMAFGTVWLRRRPGVAGMAFGALCIKPHFGVLLPVALICGRHWRAFAAAGLTVTVLAGVCTVLFGFGIWGAFVDMAVHARATIEAGKIRFVGHIDSSGAARLLGAGAQAGWAIQAAASLMAAAIVGWMWWPRARDVERCVEARMAALVAGTMVAMPFLLFYDLVMASVAAAWLVAAARRSAWLSGEQRMLAVLMVVTLLAFPIAGAVHVAIGGIVAPVLLWSSVRRFRATTQREQSPVPLAV
jgi:alpha-1,2-mannosyltransferase